MENTTNIKIPKKYHTAIKEIYRDSDGYWCMIKEGYTSGIDEGRVIHEESAKGLLREIRNIRRYEK